MTFFQALLTAMMAASMVRVDRRLDAKHGDGGGWTRWIGEAIGGLPIILAYGLLWWALGVGGAR